MNQIDNQIETNISMVRNAFKAGIKLTVASALRICKTVDLRKYVSMLRKEGLDIVSEPTINGNKKRFNTYYLKLKS